MQKANRILPISVLPDWSNLKAVSRTRWTFLGTPSYMAPEQAVGNNAAVSSVTDVYGIGAVLYQLLTGQPPFAGGATYETIKLLLDTEPKKPRLLNPKIDRDLSTICLKCLEKDPKRRYPSALDLAEDLERWLKYEPIVARHTGIVARGRKWVQRNPTSALLATSLVALAAVVGWNIWKSELVRRPVTTGIAVLPFENLSEQKENTAFADGVQDDILTKLAKIGELKVISRTSVMEYRGKRNLRQIGDAFECLTCWREAPQERCTDSSKRAVDRYAHGHPRLGRGIRPRFK